MKTYIINFHGRESGAIGTFSSYTETIEAPSKQAAILRLYEKYEHIRTNSIQIITKSN